MIEKKVQSIWPVYIVGFCWVLGGLLLPLYTLWGILITAVLSAAAYLISSKLIPAKTIWVEAPEPPFATGEQELDRVLEEARKNLAALRSLNDAIPDPTLSEEISRMEKAAGAILQEVAAHPEKGRQIRRFCTYYLPSSIKILSSYAKLGASGAQGKNASELFAEVEKNAAAIADAFEGQLDRLFLAEVLDVTTDVEVLEAMMKGDGLIE